MKVLLVGFGLCMLVFIDTGYANPPTVSVKSYDLYCPLADATGVGQVYFDVPVSLLTARPQNNVEDILLIAKSASSVFAELPPGWSFFKGTSKKEAAPLFSNCRPGHYRYLDGRVPLRPNKLC